MSVLVSFLLCLAHHCLSVRVFFFPVLIAFCLVINHVDGLAKKFGLTPEQFGENLRDSYQRHETEQFPAEPVELAKDYVCSQFSTPEAVLEGTRYMVAMQIAREPLVRHVLRQTFQERAKINIKPTKKGKKVWAGRRSYFVVNWRNIVKAAKLSSHLASSNRRWMRLILLTPSNI